ncbi:hypothetical protein JOJ87_001293 [Rhodococcus ruber]|nr:hypothetical protein [Rhodococcus ruber]
MTAEAAAGASFGLSPQPKRHTGGAAAQRER